MHFQARLTTGALSSAQVANATCADDYVAKVANAKWIYCSWPYIQSPNNRICFFSCLIVEKVPESLQFTVVCLTGHEIKPGFSSGLSSDHVYLYPPFV